jgi:hypothetical protein
VDLYLLTEAKPRSAYKQRYRQQYVGREEPGAGRRTRFGPNTPWRMKINQIYIDLRTPAEHKPKINRALGQLATAQGDEWMQKIPDHSLYTLVKAFTHRYENEGILPGSLKGSGTSGIHAQVPTNYSRIAPNFDTDVAMAHVPNRDILTKKEIATHPNPAVQKAWSTIRQDKVRWKDGAVVENSLGQPFYLFRRMYQTFG